MAVFDLLLSKRPFRPSQERQRHDVESLPNLCPLPHEKEVEQTEARASGGRRIESGFHLADGDTIIAVSLFPQQTFNDKDHTNQNSIYTYY